MQTKLTLRLEDTVIENAKAWAQARGVSLSSVVEQFFERLPAESRVRPLSAWTQRLSGAGVGACGEAGDEPLREEYLDRLEEKYR